MRTSVLVALLTGLISAVLLTSCSVVSERTVPVISTPSTQQSEWTVLFYGAGNHSADMTSDGVSQVFTCVERMRHVPPVSNVHVVACVSSSVTLGRSRLYDFSRSNGGLATGQSADFGDWGAQDMSSPQTLREFIEYAVSLRPAKKYALILMGQGNGWEGVLPDPVNGSGLPMTLADCRDALEVSRVHFNLLAWMIPGLSSVEVAYEFRNCADFMVGCPWPLPHDVSLSPAVWLTDLTVNPQMDSERLGKMMVDGLYEAAERRSNSVHYVLLRLADFHYLVPEIDSLALALLPHAEDQSVELPSLWTAAWVSQTDDSHSVDVGRLSEGVLSVPVLADDPLVTNAARHVIESLDHLVVYRRSTVSGESRRGVSIFLPLYPETAALEEYSALSLSTDHPGWLTLLQTAAAAAPNRTTISGTVRRPGYILENVYLFLNTSQVGAPEIALSRPVTIIERPAEDFLRYEATLTLGRETLACYVGLFQDLDFSGTLSTGDRYGYYRNSSPLRDWVTLVSGESLENVNVELNRTY